jgi:glycosyltransferase involved in cell wall biosynthesis
LTYVFIIDCPTPQRAPTVDIIQAALPGTRVYYVRPADDSRGWGTVQAAHVASCLDEAGARLRLILDLLRRDLEVVVLFGYRHWTRVLAAMVGRVRGIPLVVRSDSNVLDELGRPPHRHRWKRRYLRLVLGRPEIWTIGSRNDEYWAALGFCRRVRIPYTVPVPPGGAHRGRDLRRSLLGDENRKNATVFAYVGRLTVDKGVEELLWAFRLLRETDAGKDAWLLVAGRGSLASSIDMSDARIRYLGPVPYRDLGAVYRAADAVIVPSRTEPWGLVVNEALLHGARVIASDRVASADDLVTEHLGLRFPAGDVQKLLDCLCHEAVGPRGPRTQIHEVDVAELMMERLSALAHGDGWGRSCGRYSGRP